MILWCGVWVYFFFFQAEDGIRDLTVTGVQTCALPIYGKGMLVMPGLVDAHCHPFAEPMNKGMWDEVGSPQLYNTSLYEHLTVLHPDAEIGRASCRERV